VSNYSLLIS